MKYASYIALAVISLGLGWSLGHWTQFGDGASHSNEPTQMPSFSLNDLNGQAHHSSDWQGQLVLVNFWATWCAPCLKEIPLLESVYSKNAEQGFIVIGAALDDSAAVAAFVQKEAVTYPILIGDQSMFALMDQFGDTLGALPFSVLVNRQGTIVERHWGELNQNLLAGYLEKYL